MSSIAYPTVFDRPFGQYPALRWPRPRIKQWVLPSLLLATLLLSLLTSVINVSRAALASQVAARMNHNCYAGVILVGVTGGCHLGKRMAVAVQYHPNNEFSTGDAIGLGFGEANFVYGQEGIKAYRNLDKHTVVVNGRFYVFGPFYVALGVAHQNGSSRWITFERGDRKIGNTVYEDVAITVETKLKNQTAPVFAVGLHPVWGRIGVMGEVNFGLAFPKQLAEANVTADQPISDADMALFKAAIRQDAESEGFGIATTGVTFGFSPTR
ncbi:MAG: hypothetical protein AAF639_35335 [Chloroflexota bacterium]